MPLSCQLLWDVLILQDCCKTVNTTVKDLAKITRLSPAQVHRALKRLEGAHLIRWERSPGRGHRSKIVLLWRPEVIHRSKVSKGDERCSHPQNRNVSPHARDTLSPPERSKESPTGQRPPAKPLGERAVAWALARVREDLRARRSVGPERRAVILAALGPAVHRAIKKGRVRTRAELGELVGFIRARLEERRGLGEDLGATRRWAEWCVREGLRRGEEGRAAREATARFLAEEARARAEARRAWADPEVQAQVAALLRQALERDLKAGPASPLPQGFSSASPWDVRACALGKLRPVQANEDDGEERRGLCGSGAARAPFAVVAARPAALGAEGARAGVPGAGGGGGLGRPGPGLFRAGGAHLLVLLSGREARGAPPPPAGGGG
ncbi:MAG: SgrR family transcriptional regulator, partial [Candidatus Methanomethyliaceae archaeon]